MHLQLGPGLVRLITSWRFPEMLRGLTICWLSVACLSFAGCSDEIPFREVKRIDEKITPAELKSFLSIVDSLPDKKLPPFPSILPPAPQWAATRTLPVAELIHDEQKALLERSSIDWVSRHFTASKLLKRALRRERMTLDQFLGLTIVLGTTLSRGELSDDQDLDAILTRGRRIIAMLKKDQRIFSTLSEDGAYYTMEQAGWVTLVDRAQRLKLVSPENLALVGKHHERLRSLFPSEFLTNPLTGFSKILEDQGTPFEELATTGTDDHITWSREHALVGSEAPPATLPKSVNGEDSPALLP